MGIVVRPASVLVEDPCEVKKSACMMDSSAMFWTDRGVSIEPLFCHLLRNSFLFL